MGDRREPPNLVPPRGNGRLCCFALPGSAWGGLATSGGRRDAGAVMRAPPARGPGRHRAGPARPGVIRTARDTGVAPDAPDRRRALDAGCRRTERHPTRNPEAPGPFVRLRRDASTAGAPTRFAQRATKCARLQQGSLYARAPTLACWSPFLRDALREIDLEQALVRDVLLVREHAQRFEHRHRWPERNRRRRPPQLGGARRGVTTGGPTAPAARGTTRRPP